MKLITTILTMAMTIIFSGQSLAAWKTEAIGGFRSVHLYSPVTSSPIGEGRSLLIVLHGCVQSNSVFKNANLDKAAEEYGMVVAVPDAVNKQGMSCWGYWTGTPSRNSGDYKNLLNMVSTLLARTDLDIDSAQVYISGLSSGGAFAMQTGCLAPDVFAGMGISAGPSAGTSSGGALGPKEGTVASTKSNCERYSGSNKSHFATQITSTAYGTGDYTVNQGYGLQNAEAMAQIYGVSKGGTNSLGSKAKETLWSDGRVSMVAMTGVAHAWAGGSGASGSYIDGSNINYGSYLGEFFAKNNIRVGNNDYDGGNNDTSDGGNNDTGNTDSGNSDTGNIGGGLGDWTDFLPGGTGITLPDMGSIGSGTDFDWGDWGTGGTSDFDWGDIWGGGTDTGADADTGTDFDWGGIWDGGTDAEADADTGTDFDFGDIWDGGADDSADTDIDSGNNSDEEVDDESNSDEDDDIAVELDDEALADKGDDIAENSVNSTGGGSFGVHILLIIGLIAGMRKSYKK